MWERCFPRSPHIFTFNDYIYGALSISTKVNGVFLLMADFPVSLKYQSHLNINPLTSLLRVSYVRDHTQKI